MRESPEVEHTEDGRHIVVDGRPIKALAQPTKVRVTRSDRRERVRAFFARAEDPYAGADLPTASRLGAAFWIVATVITWLLLPLAPPTEPFGAWGWAIA